MQQRGHSLSYEPVRSLSGLFRPVLSIKFGPVAFNFLLNAGDILNVCKLFICVNCYLLFALIREVGQLSFLGNNKVVHPCRFEDIAVDSLARFLHQQTNRSRNVFSQS